MSPSIPGFGDRGQDSSVHNPGIQVFPRSEVFTKLMKAVVSQLAMKGRSSGLSDDCLVLVPPEEVAYRAVTGTIDTVQGMVLKFNFP